MSGSPPFLLPAVRLVRTIGAPAGAVYNAFIDPQRLQRWFAPFGHEVVGVDIDRRVGGRHRMVVDSPEGRYTMVGEYLELRPPERIVMTWSNDQAPPTPSLVVGNESVITISLRELAADLTELTLVHELSLAGTTPADLKEGWTECLDNLAVTVIAEVSQAFRDAMVESLEDSPRPVNHARRILTEHFQGLDPKDLDAVTETMPPYWHVGFQRALDELLAEPGRNARIAGVKLPSIRHVNPPMAWLLLDPALAWSPPVLTPAEYILVECSADDSLACLMHGLVMFHDDDGTPAAMWVRGYRTVGTQALLAVDLMHPSTDRAAEICDRLRRRAIDLNPFRGQVVEIKYSLRQIDFLERPEHTDADRVILPTGLLEKIEEHSIAMVKARTVLNASGRHLKRGLLLHGRPGTGKTHTIRYLVSQMPEATVVLMSGTRMVRSPNPDMQPLDVIRQLSELIVPAVVVLDDVDFIAEDRSLEGQTGSREALFALLDLLDGLDEDSDITFVLTTNRPNELEPAVAARPGRIDQAVEVPLPDADCRRRLVDLYSAGLVMKATDDEVDAFVERTDGVTASFVREAVRRAAVHALVEEADTGAPGPSDAPITVTGAHLVTALDELLDPDNPLTPVLLGAEPDHALPYLEQIVGGDAEEELDA